jgi:hypothetical protein
VRGHRVRFASGQKATSIGFCAFLFQLIFIHPPSDLAGRLSGSSMSDRAYSNGERTHFEQMQAMLSGHFLAQCLHVAAVLNIPDLIAKDRASLEELVAATGGHGPSLHRFLRVLANAGVFTEESGGRFGLTRLGTTLRSDTANTVRDMALFRVSSPIWSAWGVLLDSLKTGQPSFPRLHDTTIYTYLAEHEELGAIYNRFMTGHPGCTTPLSLMRTISPGST